MNIAGNGIPGSPDPMREIAALKQKLGAEVSRRQIANAERDRLADRVAELERSASAPAPVASAEIAREREIAAEENARLRRNAEEGAAELERVRTEWQEASEFVGATKRTADEQKARADRLEAELAAATKQVKELIADNKALRAQSKRKR